MNKSQTAQLAKLLSAAVALLTTEQPAHKPVSSYKPANKFEPKGKVSSEGRTARQLKNEVLVAKTFAKLGLKVTPRVDVLTFKEWQKKGLRPVKGCHGTFVKGVGTLFHSGQVAPDTQPTKAEMTAEVASLSFPA